MSRRFQRLLFLSFLLLTFTACDQLGGAGVDQPPLGGGVDEDAAVPTGDFGVSLNFSGPFLNDTDGSITNASDERVVSVEPGGKFYVQIDYEDPSGLASIAINLVNRNPDGLAGALDPTQSFFTLGQPTNISEPSSGCNLSDNPTSVSCIYEIQVAEDAVNIDALENSADEFAYVFRTQVANATGNTSDKAERGYVVVAGDEGGSDSQVVTIPDPKLESLIRDAVNKPEGDLTKQDLKEVKTIAFEALFQGGEDAIQDLEGLQFATNLEVLDVPFNDFRDLAPLQNLANLTRLGFANTPVSDITPLVENSNVGQGDVVDLQATDLELCPGDADRADVDILTKRGVDVSFDEPENCDTNGDEQVQVPDPVLESLIREEINKPQGDLTMRDLEKVEVIDGDAALNPEDSVQDLEGLQFATNLTELQLPFTRVSDLSPLLKNSGLGEGDVVNLNENVGGLETCPGTDDRADIDTLIERGVQVFFDEPENCSAN